MEKTSVITTLSVWVHYSCDTSLLWLKPCSFPGAPACSFLLSCSRRCPPAPAELPSGAWGQEEETQLSTTDPAGGRLGCPTATVGHTFISVRRLTSFQSTLIPKCGHTHRNIMDLKGKEKALASPSDLWSTLVLAKRGKPHKTPYSLAEQRRIRTKSSTCRLRSSPEAGESGWGEGTAGGKGEKSRFTATWKHRGGIWGGGSAGAGGRAWR